MTLSIAKGIINKTKLLICTSLILWSLLILFSLSSCSVLAKPSYEVISRETVADQSAIIINNTATTFSVPAEQANQIWARAKMFFDFFLADQKSPNEKLYEVKNDIFTNETIPSQKYSYRIVRSFSNKTVNVAVKCFPRPALGGATELANRNAKNLARFLKEGQFEALLLDK